MKIGKFHAPGYLFGSKRELTGSNGTKRVVALRRDGYFLAGYFSVISDTFKTRKQYIINI